MLPCLGHQSLDKYDELLRQGLLFIVNCPMRDHQWLQATLSSNSLLNPHQSGFTKHHSTETLLVSLYNKLVSAVSHQQVSCLCLLDISAAFDTIDHNILLQRLSSWFGVSGTALLW